MIEYEEFESVWDAIEESPEEAAKMKALSALMSQMLEIISANRWDKNEAARRFHTSLETMDDLFEHRIYRFTFDDLFAMTGSLGRRLRIEIEAA